MNAFYDWKQVGVPEVRDISMDPGPFLRTLREKGYRQERFVEAAGVDYRSWIPNWKMDATLMRFREQDSNDGLCLFRVFLLNKPARESRLRTLLCEAGLNFCKHSGLLQAIPSPENAQEPTLYCPFSLFEIEGLFILTDPLLQAQNGYFQQDSVMPLYPESYELAAMTFRHPVHRMLDIGTGSGVHGLLAARHAREVVVIDLNPRALAFTRLNAWLNSLCNLEVLGLNMSMLAGLGAFDLVVSNPPYMPETNPAAPMLASAGPDGEHHVQLILGQINSLLTTDGVAQLVHFQFDLPGSEGSQRLRNYLPITAPVDDSKVLDGRHLQLTIASRDAFDTGLDPIQFRNIRYAFSQVSRPGQNPSIRSALKIHNDGAAARLGLHW